MKKALLIILFFASINLFSYEETPDSITVQTFVFDSITTRSGTWEFPPAQQYEKVLMHYTLKCDPRTTRDNFDCGEWDYLTYTIVQDSSGQYDSTQLRQRSFVVQGSNSDEFSYTTNQTNRRIIFSREFNQVNAVNSEEVFTLGEGVENGTVNIANKKFWVLYTRDELNNQFIDGISLDLANATNEDVDIQVRFATSSESILPENYSSLKFEDLMHVRKKLSAGVNRLVEPNLLNLSSQFALILEISVESNEDVNVVNESTSFNSSREFSSNGNYLDFNGRDYIEIPSTVLQGVSNEITVQFWQKGDPSMPKNNLIFEAVNSKGQRILGSHLPWSNGQVYFDCGNDGSGYDRINTAIDPSLWKNEWNHWAFVKNASSGSMQVYCNGQLVMTGNGTKTISDPAAFRIGSNVNNANHYDGFMDDFAVFNRALNQTEIQSLIKDGPNLEDNNLILFYDFEGITGSNVPDRAQYNFPGKRLGLPAIKREKARDIVPVNSEIKQSRPRISFLKGDYELESVSPEFEIRENIPATTLFIYDYESPDRVIPIEELNETTASFRTPTDTLIVWPTTGFEYYYNQDGEVIDSVAGEAIMETLTNDDITWYSPIKDYEIDRFITPYGIGLDLGEDGFTWVIDVTDFAPILHDWVRLSAGNTQELLDLKFVFIKGTPPRDIKHFSTVYNRSTYKYPQIITNAQLGPVEHKLKDDASMFRVITRSSGHRFGVDGTDNCAEFCNRLHSLLVNDDKKYEWEGWKECGDNPVYPQGGTWLVDRTDWCPGAPVTTYHHEITDFVNPGDLITLDYDIENKPEFTAYGDWVFSSYLVQYGEANFTNDAALYDIISPNIHDEFLRMNPICNNAQIVIKNTGSEELTSLKITYGVKGFGSNEYVWNGNLKFLETEIVNLPPFDWGDGWEFGDLVFEASVSEPNGKSDEYDHNDYGSVFFEASDAMVSDVTITVSTNNYAVFGVPSPIHYQVENDLGEIVFERTNTANAETYEEELQLEEGCYKFTITNDLGYGLDYWVLRQQNPAFGTGSLRIRSGSVNKQFIPDFGNNISYQFRVLPSAEAVISSNEIDFGYIELDATAEETITIRPKNSRGITIQDLNIPFGSNKGFSIVSTNPDINQGDVTLKEEESMEVTIQLEGKKQGIKTATLEIQTNSSVQRTYSVDLVGRVDIEQNVNEIAEFLEMDYNSSLKQLRIRNKQNSNSFVTIHMTDVLGRNLTPIFDGVLNQELNLDLSGSNYSKGSYFIILRNEHGKMVLPIILD